MRKAVVQHLEENGFMASGQHGFRALRSTLTQLLAHWDSILDGLVEGSPGVDAIYLDFAKAFDKVDHGVLLHKLRDFGICGKVGTWLAEFLRNRYQIVVTDGIQSVRESVTSGVPQGTVLGPVLFLVLIADIAKGTDNHTQITSFADDTRASRQINKNHDYQQLQSDLKIIYGWARKVNMEFNGDKFEILRCWPEVKNWTQHLPFQLKNEHTYM